ncbi:MAG: energy transducer TonB [Terriglobales bacterium]
MFSSLDATDTGFRWTVRGSIAAHLALLTLAVLYRPTPIFVTASSLAMGNGDKSYRIVYFAPPGARNEPDVEVRKDLLATRLKTKPARIRKKHGTPEQANVAEKLDANNKDARAGSTYGSLYSGPWDGHDVRPAYPVVFPNPPVSRSDFPEGFQGDVVVEVTIDKLGNVIDLRLLQGVGGGIDEKVMATLKGWHYKPATMDGEPIAEKHDVHFHYPG